MRVTDASPDAQWMTLRFRLAGLLPLAFFFARVVEYVRVGTPQHILWSCHVSNLMLAIGMFFGIPFLIRITAFWLILGVPPWFYDMVATGLITPVSIFSHLGGASLGIYALWKVRPKCGSWILSLLFFLILQQITRLLTPADIYMNVNVAHFAYGPWKDLITDYRIYWVVNTFLTGLALWIMEWMLIFLLQNREGSARVEKS